MVTFSRLTCTLRVECHLRVSPFLYRLTTRSRVHARIIPRPLFHSHAFVDRPFKQGDLMVVTRCLQVLLQLGSVVLPHVLLVYSGRRPLELQLFCSREEENSWRRAQLLCGSSYYANSPGILHISVKAALLPLRTQNRQLRGQPWSVLSLADKTRRPATLFPKSHPLGRQMLPHVEGKAAPC